MTTVLLPKNRGLAAQALRALEDLVCPHGVERRLVRGEDVPYLAREIARSGRPVFGVTGDDLVDEWLASGGTLGERLKRRRISWSDPQAVFGKPALCFIARKGASVVKTGRMRVAFCTRYRMLTERYLQRWEALGIAVERVPIQGAVESALLAGVADFIVDVVVSGRTIREAGLEVREVISTSDLAVLESV
ncbi:MAG TPA: hypothetical protein VGZ02_15110 [Candidatus Baltobacteraceae bacterium]|jgi:ATP phosphoribosyltransferase|nr:hypothetical protein [Candidatus Baltobacteraceae bacterium]